MQNKTVHTLHDKLVVYKEIFKNRKYVTLIVVLEPLRHSIFSHYHASPNGGHMGVYKITFRIRMHFFWPKLRELIKTWVKACAHCSVYDVWTTRK